MGNALLIVLIVLAAGGALFALVRGIVAFLQTTEADLKSDGTGPSVSGMKQNKAMFARVGFQAAAVLLVVLLLPPQPPLTPTRGGQAQQDLYPHR